MADNRTDFPINRGHNMHEHINGFGLINMNGRVYDPKLGRFLSPDPMLQDPSNTQNMNRYSYVWNNPLKYVDPSGYQNQAAAMTMESGVTFVNGQNIYGGHDGGSWDSGGGMNWSSGTIYSADGSLNIAGLTFEQTNTNINGTWLHNSNLTKLTGDEYRKLVNKSRKPVITSGAPILLTFGNREVKSFDGIASNGGGFELPTRNGVSGPWAESASDNNLSNNFIASTAFSTTTSFAKGSYNIINNEFLRQSGEIVPLKVPKGLKIVGKYGGFVFTAYSLYDVDAQWRRNQISTGRMMIEQVSNGLGAIPVFGTGWGAGWNLGKAYGPSTWYGTNDHKWYK